MKIDFSLDLYGKDTFLKERGWMSEYLLNKLPDNVKVKVKFHGHVNREILTQEYLVSNVAVFPSFTESFGIAPIEAMSCGCPTIFTAFSSGTEIINNEVDGLLVNPHKPEEIAAAIIRFLNDVNFAEKIGGNGVVKSKTFSAREMTEKSLAFYQSCIEKFKKY
jgi:glycosyltransferase involved in cell wall biosynthesis